MWIKIINQFTIQLIFTTIHGLTALFDTIHELHCTISINFYFYLQYFKSKDFSFNKINGIQTDPKTFWFNKWATSKESRSPK